MPTTVQVSEITRQLLASLKEKSGKSYDKILREMLAQYMKSSGSLAGAYSHLKWSKKDRMKFTGE